MTHMVTRCPKCATAFRVTKTQLESAKGSVRCGSCLHIFKAHDDLITPTHFSSQATASSQTPEHNNIDATPAQKPKASTTTVSTDSNADFPDDMLISDDMDAPSTSTNSYEFEGFLDIDLSPKPSKSLFERNIQVHSETTDEEVDESWAEALLREENDPLAPADRESGAYQSPANSQRPALQNLSHSIRERHNVTVPDASEYARINEEFSSLYKTPAFSGNGDAALLQEDPLPSDVPLAALREQPATPEASIKSPTTFGTGFFRQRDEAQVQPPKHPLKSQPAIHATQESRATLLKQIVPSPIEMTAQRIINWSQTTHWGRLSLAAALILIIQIGYFKFDQLSLHEPYRSAYRWLCPVFACKLPALVDSSKIVAYQLILRNHPSVPNALLLDVMIRNDAGFEQPFPDLLLEFTTLDDKPVAARRFKPKEYLNGELAGRELIPSKQPIHITLELSDPGSEAVNYHMSIVR